MNRNKRLGLVLNENEKVAVNRLAEIEGGLSQAALVRRLIRKAAHENGLWPGELNDRWLEGIAASRVKAGKSDA